MALFPEVADPYTKGTKPAGGDIFYISLRLLRRGESQVVHTWTLNNFKLLVFML